MTNHPTAHEAGPDSGAQAQQTWSLGDAASDVYATLREWRESGKVQRLWAQDPALWSGTDEDQWLGWLDVVEQQRNHNARLAQLVADIRGAGFASAVLLGMGGSSLCPEVLSKTFGTVPGFPRLLMIDSTVPAQIIALERRLDLTRTLFIVSSKSGGTTETKVLTQYFFARVQQAVGAERAGSHFVAITDPGTALHKKAEADHFRHIMPGMPSIGGRYSAMSNFGVVPAAIMGVDVPRFLGSTEIMVRACAAQVPPEVNPGVALGVILGTLAQKGRDKVTLITSPVIGTLGAWLEQLLAESTGKQSKGLIPVDEEQLGPVQVYRQDRLFIYLRCNPAPAPEQDIAVAALSQAGHPVVRIVVDDMLALGQEFFRWEIATAVAGALLGINPFDQPDVEASKVATRGLTAAYEENGKLPDESPLLQDGDLTLFTDTRNAAALRAAVFSRNAAEYLAAHLGRLQPGDFFAMTAYIEMNAANHQELQAMRHAVRDAKRVATTLGYGPRFLHSTGQLHKGGPNTGVFLQITAEDAEDLAIPGQRYTFGLLKRFQAQGDFQVLTERGRRVLRVHLGPDVHAGLTRLREIVRRIVAKA